MVKINISLPDELKERMDKLKDSASVNWSRVAAHAFDLEVKSKGVDMSDATMERLRASREQYTIAAHAKGAEAGKRWAVNKAAWENVLAVVALEGGAGVEDLRHVFLELGYEHEDFAAVFGREARDVAPITDDEARGFIEGVTLVHDEVD